jgi:hypothetical protein
MAIRDIDALRVVADPTYAATLTAEEWESLSVNADWMHLTTEYAEVVDQAVGSIRPTMAQIAPPAPNLGAAQTQFKYVGTAPPRVQGLGVVSNVGWYTENLNRGNQLFMVTLRSPHPHARVRSIDSADAEKFPGVGMVLHRFNLPREYQRIKLGSGLTANRTNQFNASGLYLAFNGRPCSPRPALCYRPLLAFLIASATR